MPVYFLIPFVSRGRARQGSTGTVVQRIELVYTGLTKFTWEGVIDKGDR